ncbi:RNA polymerase sigma factor [Sphingomonas sp. PAMC 26617]|uniref:RNA polymerase sigma factor n=1 Tax=Sphingomonas sp. PAMC 26617 TaxID=1112216 RepID=UPI0002883374|nr:sigma-70 family RNA polymerase sigma factor [Sphingomonas sp. PAMC 26617]
MTTRREAEDAALALARTPERIAREDDDEFGTMLIQQAAKLSTYARRLTGNPVDGDDLLQDTLLRCWTARATFMPGTSMAAWIRTVMRNSFLTGRRRARFQADMPEDAFDRLLSVSENQSASVNLRDVDWAMTELNLEQREAVIMASQGVTIKEAAERLAIAPGTYKSRLWRGRERLRSLTEDRATPLLSDRRAAEQKPEKRPCKRERRDWTGVMIG